MGIFDTLQEESTFSRASGNNYNYVVQFVKEYSPKSLRKNAVLMARDRN